MSTFEIGMSAQFSDINAVSNTPYNSNNRILESSLADEHIKPSHNSKMRLFEL
jgi:hypothetical protein